MYHFALLVSHYIIYIQGSSTGKVWLLNVEEIDSKQEWEEIRSTSANRPIAAFSTGVVRDYSVSWTDGSHRFRALANRQDAESVLTSRNREAWHKSSHSRHHHLSSTNGTRQKDEFLLSFRLTKVLRTEHESKFLSSSKRRSSRSYRCHVIRNIYC